jgi:hypothetical protein
MYALPQQTKQLQAEFLVLTDSFASLIYLTYLSISVLGLKIVGGEKVRGRYTGY